MRMVLLFGRLCFSALFIMSGYTHLQPGTIGMGISAGVPWFLVMASGLMACAGGLMIALGYKARLGGFLVAAFLVPVTLTMHAFWDYANPAERMMQQISFMKNLSMLGGALAFWYFGSGPWSLDNRRVPYGRRERLEAETPRREVPADALIRRS